MESSPGNEAYSSCVDGWALARGLYIMKKIMLFLFEREKRLGESVAREWVGFHPWPWKPCSRCPIQEWECGGGRGWVCQQRGKASARKGRTLYSRTYC